MKRQLILQSLKLQPFIEIVVYLFLIVPQFHEIGEMKGNVSEMGLVVFVEHFLHILHVVEREVLLQESYF